MSFLDTPWGTIYITKTNHFCKSLIQLSFVPMSAARRTSAIRGATARAIPARGADASIDGLILLRTLPALLLISLLLITLIE